MTHLGDQTWLTSSATRSVISALEAEGGPDCARFVGGCVRNAILGAPVDDLDVATRLTPDRVVKALKAAGLRVIPTGIDHGTVTALSERLPYEITTLRRDVETDGRHATVAFTTDWAEDAARRDFRLNALYADASGTIHDPTGAGLADAEAGRIIFVGEARQRIEEDYLRILRFFRFHAWYGRGVMDKAALEACAALAEGVTSLSAERVSKELLKLLAAPDPGMAVAKMDETGVLSRVLGLDGDVTLFNAMVAVSRDPVLRLSALLPADPAVVEARARALRLSNAERLRLVDAAQGGVNLSMLPHEARVALYHDGKQAFTDGVQRAWAAGGDEVAAKGLMALASDWSKPVMPVGGRDLSNLGVRPGPLTGQILKAFETEWISADFPADGHQERLTALVARLG
jgi:poly(A) polymerase